MEKKRPNVFIIPGMPRCATTFLYHNLQKHPSVFCPFRKETNYFSVNYHKGIDWYRHLYREIRPGQIGADVSPSYLLHKKAIGRIKDFNPEIKIVLGVRDLAEWSLSLYNQLLTHLWRGPTFTEFIQSFPYPFGDAVIPIELRGGFVTNMIEDYREAFGDNLLLYHFDFFKGNSLAVLRSIERFLGIPPHYDEHNFDNMVINAGNRRNVSIITYILSREKLISVLGAVFPRQAVQFLRSVFYNRLSKDKGGLNSKVYTPENLRIAKEAFAEEGAMITELFAECAVQLGSGMPFDHFLD
jgi:hypothetical protein